MMKNAVTRYKDRRHAGEVLSECLGERAKEDPVAIGLPRGGVVVAFEVAKRLGCELDVIMAGKLRAPGNPELAFGAITETGLVFLNRDVLDSIEVGRDYLEAEKKERLKTITERLKDYRAVKKKIPLKGRVVMLIDDGLATGSTMISAVQAAKAEGATKIIVAVPGGPEDTVRRLKSMPEVTEVICPLIPAVFYAVSQIYADFSQTEDAEVVKILQGPHGRTQRENP